MQPLQTRQKSLAGHLTLPSCTFCILPVRASSCNAVSSDFAQRLAMLILQLLEHLHGNDGSCNKHPITCFCLGQHSYGKHDVCSCTTAQTLSQKVPGMLLSTLHLMPMMRQSNRKSFFGCWMANPGALQSPRMLVRNGPEWTFPSGGFHESVLQACSRIDKMAWRGQMPGTN